MFENSVNLSSENGLIWTETPLINTLKLVVLKTIFFVVEWFELNEFDAAMWY